MKLLFKIYQVLAQSSFLSIHVVFHYMPRSLFALKYQNKLSFMKTKNMSIYVERMMPILFSIVFIAVLDDRF